MIKHDSFYFLLSLLSFSFASNIFSQSPTMDKVTVQQIDYYTLDRNTSGDPILNSDTGIMDFHYTPNTDDKYLNAVASFNSANDQWIIQNLYLPDNTLFNGSHIISQKFDLSLFGINDGNDASGSMSVRVYLANNPITSQSNLNMSSDSSDHTPTIGDISQTSENDDPDTLESATDTGESFSTDNTNTVQTTNYRGCEIPNIDLNSSSHGASVGYAGDQNACAPAAAANACYG